MPPPWAFLPMPPLWPGTAPGELLQRKKKKKRKMRARSQPPEATLEAKPLLSGGVEGPLAAQDTLASKPVGWEVAVHDAPRRSFVSLLRGAFAAEALRKWEDMSLKELPWARPLQSKRSTGEARPMPRRACWLTRGGCSCRYEYGGTSFAPLEMPSWLVELTETVCRVSGVSEQPNSCNANLYGSGAEGVGWHADDEPLFRATEQDALIMSLSLGAPRTFEVRPKHSETDSVQLLLCDGDLCTMEGLFQKHYRHCVPLEEVLEARVRVNLTWRWIKRHQPHCILYDPEEDTAKEGDPEQEQWQKEGEEEEEEEEDTEEEARSW